MVAVYSADVYCERVSDGLCKGCGRILKEMSL